MGRPKAFMGGEAERLNDALTGFLAPAMVTAFIRRMEDQTWRMGGIHEQRGREDAGLSCYMNGREWLAKLGQQTGMGRTQMLDIRRKLVQHRVIFYEPDPLEPGCGRLTWNIATEEWIPLGTANWGGRRAGAGYTHEQRATRAARQEAQTAIERLEHLQDERRQAFSLNLTDGQASGLNLIKKNHSSLDTPHSSLDRNLSSLDSTQATTSETVGAEGPLTIIDNKKGNNNQLHTSELAGGEPRTGVQDQTRMQSSLQRDTPSKPAPPKPQKPAFAPESEPYLLAKHLLDSILTYKPEYYLVNKIGRAPLLQKWAAEFDRILRIDKRDPRHLHALIEYVAQDVQPGPKWFGWQGVVLSPSNLRDGETFERIDTGAKREAQRRRAQQQPKPTTPGRNEPPSVIPPRHNPFLPAKNPQPGAS